MTKRVPSEVRFGSEEVDRLFEKQAASDKETQDAQERMMLDWYRSEWLTRRQRSQEFPNDARAQVKRWKADREGALAEARLEARKIQRNLDDKFQKEYLRVVKEGVLEGAIQIHETSTGFMIDTPLEEVQEYVQTHAVFRDRQPVPDDLRNGWFLLGEVVDWEKERVNLVRNSLIDEFQAERPSDLMLVDLATSNYIRAMYAAQTELESIRYADHYRMEMYEIVMEGLQGYIQACQNQLVRALKVLERRRQPDRGSVFTHETYTRTDVNLASWGLPLLLALAEITESKEREIGIDEIKLTMAKYGVELSPEMIPNAWVGYALVHFGFTEKVHLKTGNRYNIDRRRVLTLLDEDLKT